MGGHEGREGPGAGEEGASQGHRIFGSLCSSLHQHHYTIFLRNLVRDLLRYFRAVGSDTLYPKTSFPNFRTKSHGHSRIIRADTRYLSKGERFQNSVYASTVASYSRYSSSGLRALYPHHSTNGMATTDFSISDHLYGDPGRHETRGLLRPHIVTPPFSADLGTTRRPRSPSTFIVPCPRRFPKRSASKCRTNDRQ